MSDSDIVIRVRTDGIAGAEGALKRLRDVGVSTETVTDRMAASWERQRQGVQANIVAYRAMQSLGIVTFLAGAATGVARLNDEWTTMTNKLANANTANERMVDVQNRVFDIAQRTRTGLEASSTLYTRIVRSLDQYGVSADQAARITETVNKAMIVSGATSAEANAAIIQLSQGLQSGTLRGDEFRSVAEQAPRLLKAMADALGVTTGELRALAGQGKLTGTVVANAIFQASNAIDKEFNNTTATFSQKLTLAQNNLIKFAGTSDSVSSTTGLLGDSILTLSNNMGTLATGAGILAAAFTGRLITAFVASQAASIRNATLAAQETAAARALTSARVQDAAAAYQQAQATLAQAAAERTSIQAALQANQQYYKGVSTLSALMNNTRLVGVATNEVAVAQGALGNAIATTTARQTALNVAMAAGRGALSLLGGPAGLIIMGASAWYMWNQAQERAIDNARQLATDTETLTDRLSKLTTEQQRALQVELQRAQTKLVDALNAEELALRELEQRRYNANLALKNSEEGTRSYASAQKALKDINDDITVQEGKISGTQQNLSSTRDNLRVVTENLAAGERQLKAAVVDTNGAMGIAMSAAAKRSDDLTRALQSQNAEMEIASLKVQGHAREASILQDVQNRMGKVYAANKDFIDNYIAGHVDATAVLTNEEKGIVEFINSSGKAFDMQEQLRQQRKAAANENRENRAAARYADQWDKAYERVEAAGATAIDKLNIQQAAEERIMRDRASKAGATQQQLNNALLAIQEKYNRERQKVAGQYDPSYEIERSYNEANKTITQLEKNNLLSGQQANQARLEAQGTYLQQRLQMIKDAAVSEQDALKGEYDPVQAAQNEYTEQLVLLDEMHAQGLVKEQAYYDERFKLQSEFAQRLAVAQNQSALSVVSSISTMAGSVATLLEASGDKSSAAYKTMFAMSKAFSIAEATMKLSVAMAQALAAPDSLSVAQKFANYAAVAAAGASLISGITSMSLTGMAHNGISEVPREGTWLLDKGERVLSAQQNSDFTNFMRGGGSSGGDGTRPVNLIQNINVNGNGDAALTRAVQQATRDGAEQGYAKVLQDTTSRGQISRTIGR